MSSGAANRLMEAAPRDRRTTIARRLSSASAWNARSSCAAPAVDMGRMTSTGAVQADLPLTTAQELPGAQVAENLGLCFGLIVRSMGFAKGFTASFSALRSGEVSQYTEVLEDSRRHAVDRMIANAHVLGADAIIAVRFDSSEMGQNLTEILAYGTAVKLAR